MAVIKFDSEKADALIRDLMKISSDIESNLGKVYTNSYGKEINLNDSRLKVYGFRNKVIQIPQDDGTIVEETIREQYLKHDFVSNARAYNQHVRNIYRKSNVAKTNVTKVIESVVNSLKKVKNLINEYETEQGLTLASSLEDVGQFDFNFLSAYGPMGRPDNYSSSFGTIVVDEAFTSRYLGVLGERPTSINLEKLKVFDDIFDIAKNNELTYEEQLAKVKTLLMDNVLKVDVEEIEAKSKFALESMIGITKTKDIAIDDSLKIETLIGFDIPVIEDLVAPDLTLDLENVVDKAANVVAGGILIDSLASNHPPIRGHDREQNNGRLPFDRIVDNVNDLLDKHSPLESQLGINSDVKFDDINVKENMSNREKNLDGESEGGSVSSASSGPKTHTPPAQNNDKGNMDGLKKPAPEQPKSSSERVQDVKTQNFESQSKPVANSDIPKADRPGKIEMSVERPKMNSAIGKEEFIEVEPIDKPQIMEETKMSPDEMVIEQQIQNSKIDINYERPVINDASDIGKITIELDESTGKKGAGLIAGAAGLSAIGNSGGSGSVIPQVNGMAAGEIINNTPSTPSVGDMSMLIDGNVNSSPSTGGVQTGSAAPSAIGGESTSDRGSLSTNNHTTKSTSTSVSGRGGSTLEDKDQNKDENTYGKPNKPSDVEDNSNKGMLGEASIAELDATVGSQSVADGKHVAVEIVETEEKSLFSTSKGFKIVKQRKEEEVMEKTLVIEGMMCPHCSGRVHDALEANDAIANAVVSHETGTAVVTLAAEISDEALAKMVTDAGYKVIEVK